MSKGPAEVHDRISIGGIKLSPELSQFSCSYPQDTPTFFTPLLKAIADEQINIVYFSLTNSGEVLNLHFCVEAIHRPAVENLLLPYEYKVCNIRTLPSIGTVTVFPHRNSLNLLGRVLTACGPEPLSISGLLTSISALSFTAPYEMLDDIVAKLTNLFDLPENHAPFRPQSILVNMIETRAVYWEPVIRVYGIDVMKDVTLLDLSFSAQDMLLLGKLLTEHSENDRGFIMVLLEAARDGIHRMILAMHRGAAKRLVDHLENCQQKGYTPPITTTEKLEVLFFHGPHFQDRYGIVEALFRSFAKQDITLHLVGCTGTSVYLVVGDGESARARDMLAGDFIVP